MIDAILNILNLYVAIVLHYILKLPFAVLIIFAILLVFIGLKLILFLVRRVIGPLILILLKYIIYFLQLLAFTIAKKSTKYRNKIENFDEILNTFGMKLTQWQEQLKVKAPESGKKIGVYGFFILLFLIVVFIVAPHYMEPLLTGNAKIICSRINKVSNQILGGFQSYADEYYTPVIKEKDDLENTSMVSTDSKSDEGYQYILHLSSEGYYGANLRSSPEKISTNVLTTVSGEDELIYENEIVNDGSITWIKVSTEKFSEAWISKKLIQEEDLQAAGIE
ncbi:hypothetical protein IMSAGC011_02286 [Lachnospiraceae bacterium]|nr:hypothetical protein IMSAGC011_02286 [Lachnospiraceae bacterium]